MWTLITTEKIIILRWNVCFQMKMKKDNSGVMDLLNRNLVIRCLLPAACTSTYTSITDSMVRGIHFGIDKGWQRQAHKFQRCSSVHRPRLHEPPSIHPPVNWSFPSLECRNAGHAAPQRKICDKYCPLPDVHSTSFVGVTIVFFWVNQMTKKEIFISSYHAYRIWSWYLQNLKLIMWTKPANNLWISQYCQDVRPTGTKHNGIILVQHKF